MNNLGRKAHVCVSVCLSPSAATSPFKERSKTQRGTKKCWRLFQKVFFFFSFFATRIQQKPNIKAGPERDRNKRRRRETPTRPSTHPFEGRASVCVCVCTTAIEMCVLEEVRYRIPKFAAAAAVAANGWLQVPAAPGCCNTCYGPRGCSRLLCLQRFDTSAACYFELTIPCALTRAHTHKKRETQKATYKAAVQQQAGANASPM